MTYADQAVLKLLAEKNWRGIPIYSLMADLQSTRDRLDLLATDPDFAIGFQRPSDCPQEEWIESHRYFWQCTIDSILKEIKRREAIRYDLNVNPDRNLIQAIKESIRIEDVIGWYCKVITPRTTSHTNSQFRCRLHGEDKSPSGVIYTKEQRWWCFGCNKGGDIVDAVQAFEHIELHQAIAKLARCVGLDTKPVFGKPAPQVTGGASL